MLVPVVTPSQITYVFFSLSASFAFVVEYVLEYSLKKDLPQECIDEFALKNSTIHVWPYWREYLSSICERLNLPKLMLPTMQLTHHSRKADK